jgi:hypothetical protein
VVGASERAKEWNLTAFRSLLLVVPVRGIVSRDCSLGLCVGVGGALRCPCNLFQPVAVVRHGTASGSR